MENAPQYIGMWQHIQEYIDEKINRLVDNIYLKLNKKLDALINQPNTRHNNGNAPKFQPRLINLTNIKYTKEQVQTLSLCPNYAVGQEPKQYINKLIIDTKNAIRCLERKIKIPFVT